MVRQIDDTVHIVREIDETAFYKSQLRTVLDLYDVITHLTNFNDWRRRLSSQQLIITTFHQGVPV